MESDIILLEESQLGAAGEMLAHAFFDDPLVGYVFPEEATRARLLPWHYGALVRYGHLFGEIYTTC